MSTKVASTRPAIRPIRVLITVSPDVRLSEDAQHNTPITTPWTNGRGRFAPVNAMAARPVSREPATRRADRPPDERSAGLDRGEGAALALADDQRTVVTATDNDRLANPAVAD